MSDPPLIPRFLTREQAAHYLGVGTTTFDREVAAGIWPPPMRRGVKLTALTWDRLLLDRAADRLAGLVDAHAPGDDLAAAEQRALEASRDTTRPARTQKRQAAA